MISGVEVGTEAYLNGEFLPLHEAKISVLDRGFILGDGVYEMIPVYNGRPFLVTEHLNRLERSLRAIRLSSPFDRSGWVRLITGLLARSLTPYCYVYLQVTRGVAPRSHAFPEAAITPTVFGMTSPFTPPTAAQREHGMTLISIPDERWLHCNIKSISLLGNVLAKQKAIDAGANEVAQFRDGMLTEGASCNIWIVSKHAGSSANCVNLPMHTKDGTLGDSHKVVKNQHTLLLAPPANNLVLEGIRYALITDLAAQAGISFEMRPIHRLEVEQADEIFVSSAGLEILPVLKLDDKPISHGKPGPIYGQLRAAYDRRLAELAAEPAWA